MVELVEAGELAPKTVNNTRTCLSVALGEAVRRKLVPSNPCEWIKPLPVEKVEIDYLRLAEIDRQLQACPDHYLFPRGAADRHRRAHQRGARRPLHGPRP